MSVLSSLLVKILASILVTWCFISIVLLIRKPTSPMIIPLYRYITVPQADAETKSTNDALKNDDKLKTILYWHPFFQRTDFYFGFGREAFIKNNCSCNRCFATYNKTYMAIDKFDAIVFHGPSYKFKQHKMPSVRSPHQLYVYVALESPLMYPVPEDLIKAFNVTATYRIDSDISHPYFSVHDAIDDSYVGPKFRPTWVAPNYSSENLNQYAHIYERKTKPVAWFVSNCRRTQSNRMEYVKELQKYISVDIYGRCGTLKCPHDNETVCKEKLRNDYFFYLSFENSICEDYVTEKFQNPMSHDAIPVTLNGADMTMFAPPHSYIEVGGMTPLELSTKLTFLMGNSTEYLKYFWWKKTYKYKYRHPGLCVCDICKIVNRLDGERRWYGDLKKWYHGSSGNPICVPKADLTMKWTG